MKILKTKFKDLIVFESNNFTDKRGYFRELTHQKYIKEKLIFTVVSKSKKKCFKRSSHAEKITTRKICFSS